MSLVLSAKVIRSAAQVTTGRPCVQAEKLARLGSRPTGLHRVTVLFEGDSIDLVDFLRPKIWASLGSSSA